MNNKLVILLSFLGVALAHDTVAMVTFSSEHRKQLVRLPVACLSENTRQQVLLLSDKPFNPEVPAPLFFQASESPVAQKLKENTHQQVLLLSDKPFNPEVPAPLFFQASESPVVQKLKNEKYSFYTFFSLGELLVKSSYSAFKDTQLQEIVSQEDFFRNIAISDVEDFAKLQEAIRTKKVQNSGVISKCQVPFYFTEVFGDTNLLCYVNALKNIFKNRVKRYSENLELSRQRRNCLKEAISNLKKNLELMEADRVASNQLSEADQQRLNNLRINQRTLDSISKDLQEKTEALAAVEEEVENLQRFTPLAVKNREWFLVGDIIKTECTYESYVQDCNSFLSQYQASSEKQLTSELARVVKKIKIINPADDVYGILQKIQKNLFNRLFCAALEKNDCEMVRELHKKHPYVLKMGDYSNKFCNTVSKDSYDTVLFFLEKNIRLTLDEEDKKTLFAECVRRDDNQGFNLLKKNNIGPVGSQENYGALGLREIAQRLIDTAEWQNNKKGNPKLIQDLAYLKKVLVKSDTVVSIEENLSRALNNGTTTFVKKDDVSLAWQLLRKIPLGTLFYSSIEKCCSDLFDKIFCPFE